MAQRYASGKNALGLCDVCGFQYRLHDLRVVVEKGRETGIKACDQCWDQDHPQNKLGMYPVDDPQALRDPRPDVVELSAARAQVVVVTPVVTFGRVGAVTVSTT